MSDLHPRPFLRVFGAAEHDRAAARERSGAGAWTRALVAASALAVPWSAAPAQTVAPPPGLVHLQSTATLDVARDLMTVVFSTTREGADAASVQTQLKQALDAALAEARRAARPGQVEVQTGNFSLSPRYAAKGGISGWQGSTELMVEGRDMAAIAQLAGRITTLAIARVGYGLSRELRERSESEVAAQAIARYRAKAADYARQFGYGGYVLQEVRVASADAAPPIVRPMLRSMMAAAPASDEALPVEAGKGSIGITVDGTVQMTR